MGKELEDGSRRNLRHRLSNRVSPGKAWNRGEKRNVARPFMEMPRLRNSREVRRCSAGPRSRAASDRGARGQIGNRTEATLDFVTETCPGNDGKAELADFEPYLSQWFGG